MYIPDEHVSIDESLMLWKDGDNTYLQKEQDTELSLTRFVIHSLDTFGIFLFILEKRLLT